MHIYIHQNNSDCVTVGPHLGTVAEGVYVCRNQLTRPDKDGLAHN